LHDLKLHATKQSSKSIPEAWKNMASAQDGGALASGAHAPVGELTGRPGAVKLRFCPNSNDLLYPKEDRELKKLVYACRNCDYKVDADDHCVYRHTIHHTAAETTTIIQDVRTDPTLPRSSDVRCPRCEHNEAVFFSLTTSEGMSLFFQCVSCAHKWKDEGGAI
jgi:DNA-directed RNA polymerase II subunit RPB9